MKGHLILIALLLFAACGKETKKKTTSYSLSQLQTSGISFVSVSNGVYVYCSNTGTTNQQRLNELQTFSSSIGLNNSNTQNYTIGNTTLTVAQTSSLLTKAIYQLLYSNLSSTYCPSNVIAKELI
jgi:hypothetical protein